MKYKIDVIGYADFYMSKGRDKIIIPYKIDIDALMVKTQTWFIEGGVLCDWISLKQLNRYEKISLENTGIQISDLDNVDEKLIEELFVWYSKQNNHLIERKCNRFEVNNL